MGLRNFLARAGRETREPEECLRGNDCWAELGVVHYHWGYGQRHTSLVPVTGPNSFSDGRPYVKLDTRAIWERPRDER